MNPGGARGLTPRRGEEETGVVPRGICQGAGEGRRKTACRKGGGEAGLTVASRCRQRTSNTAFSSPEPSNVVSFRRSSSNLSVFSSSSRAASCSSGRQSS